MNQLQKKQDKERKLRVERGTKQHEKLIKTPIGDILVPETLQEKIMLINKKGWKENISKAEEEYQGEKEKKVDGKR